MRNRKHSKITILILTLAMMLSMGTAAFATDTGASESSAASFTITKEILVYNDESTTVYGPGIEFTYTVEPATTTTQTVTDKDGDSMTVSSGVAGGLTLTDDKATFTKNAAVSATSSGTSITDTVGLSIDLTKFTAAGIYRYLLTETKPTDFETAGLTRPSAYETTRYIDVYIKNDGDNLAVAGTVVFFKENDNIDAKTSANNKITGKTTGFTDSYDSSIDGEEGSAGSGMADKYYTYNYTLTKTIAGTMADKTHYFPFTIATSGAVADMQFTVTATENTNLVSGVDSNGIAKTGSDVSAKLKDGQTVTIKGLPANTSINVTETNDTSDTYKVKAEDATAGSLIAETATAAGESKETTAKPVSGYAGNKTTKPDPSLKATTFTNTLNEISPTNVVIRYAPYLFILGGAVMLLIVSRRRRTEEE